MRSQLQDQLQDKPDLMTDPTPTPASYERPTRTPIPDRASMSRAFEKREGAGGLEPWVMTPSGTGSGGPTTFLAVSATLSPQRLASTARLASRSSSATSHRPARELGFRQRDAL
jgi:hypothetical protein